MAVGKGEIRGRDSHTKRPVLFGTAHEFLNWRIGISAEFAEDAESAEEENPDGRRGGVVGISEKRLVTASPTMKERFASLEFMGRHQGTKKKRVLAGCEGMNMMQLFRYSWGASTCVHGCPVFLFIFLRSIGLKH